MSEELIISDPYELAEYIGKAEKQTPVTAYIIGDLIPEDLEKLNYYGSSERPIIKTTLEELKTFLSLNKEKIKKVEIENNCRNSAIPLLDLTNLNARIEPGAIIRDQVKIGDNAVIMMGAVINIGAEIGEGAMIDMNSVVGGRAVIGKNSHLGAGAVLAGVIEPPSSQPVRVGDNVMVGANSVVLEGVQVGDGAVIAAGSVVTEDVPPNSVVAGSPAKIVKEKDSKTEDKVQIMDDLRTIK